MIHNTVKVEIFRVSEQCVVAFDNMSVEDAVTQAVGMAEKGKLLFTPIDKRFVAYGEPLASKGKEVGKTSCVCSSSSTRQAQKSSAGSQAK